MKTIALAIIAAGLCSCATTVTTNTLPDGTTVTVTAKSADPVAIKAALDAAAIIVPVVQELAKSQNDNPATP
jgi:hypothetical protein